MTVLTCGAVRPAYLGVAFVCSLPDGHEGMHEARQAGAVMPYASWPEMYDATLPYAGTQGWSGTDTSRQRAETDATDGTARRRQTAVIRSLFAAGSRGMTVKEARDRYGWHHGQASSVLSVLHKEGRIELLAEKRHRCHVYVLPPFAEGKALAARRERRTYQQGHEDGYSDGFKAGVAWSTEPPGPPPPMMIDPEIFGEES